MSYIVQARKVLLPYMAYLYCASQNCRRQNDFYNCMACLSTEFSDPFLIGYHYEQTSSRSTQQPAAGDVVTKTKGACIIIIQTNNPVCSIRRSRIINWRVARHGDDFVEVKSSSQFVTQDYSREKAGIVAVRVAFFMQLPLALPLPLRCSNSSRSVLKTIGTRLPVQLVGNSHQYYHQQQRPGWRGVEGDAFHKFCPTASL